MRILTGILTAAGPAASAITVAEISIHGSISQTASWSDEFNFYGNTQGSLEPNITEVIVNGVRRFDNGIRVGAQVYAYKLASEKDVKLDWANLDYQFRPEFGIRVGRNKLPQGLYNDAQDLDQVRTFASLPFAFYPRAFRAITASTDGINLYGNVGLGAAGSLDYQAFAGRMDDSDRDTLFIRSTDGLVQIDQWNVQGLVFGGWALWNTPIEGLRVGASVFGLPKSELPGKLARYDELPLSARPIADNVNRFMGPGAWDRMFAGQFSSTHDVECYYSTFSLEYTFGDWIAAAEYRHLDIEGTSTTPSFAALGFPASQPYARYNVYYYGQLTWQATDQLGLGVYASFSDSDRKDQRNQPRAREQQWDYAVAGSYAIRPWWTVKGEVHFLDGNGLAASGGDDNGDSSTFSDNWTYLVFKTTFSF